MKKNYKDDLPSLKRQNLKLLAEREVHRDEIRILMQEREGRNKKLTELWGNLTDIKHLVELTREVPPGDTDWDGLVDAVESLVNDYARLDVDNHKLGDRIEDVRRDLIAERSKTWIRRLWESIKGVFHAA